ncbi:MAG TPA: hypothetical protein VKF39_00120 [Nitrososphaerales archaeon]|nr:hypothetical protein [Nitrososphaerales archaeon]
MLSTLDYLNLVVAVAVVATYVYVAYAAFGIRRTLAGGVYRRQALGVCLIALTFAADYLSNFLPYSGILGFLSTAAFYAMALVLLYWVDSSILASRRTDPLFRDTLRWNRIRPAVWVCEISSIIVPFALFIYYSFVSVATIPDFVNNLLNYIFAVPIYIAALAGVLVMPMAARRSRDSTLRKHLEWFFVFIATQLVLQGGVDQIFFSGSVSAYNLVDGIALIVGLYPLYRSAKGLVPLYKFDVEKAAEMGEVAETAQGIPSLSYRWKQRTK